MTAELFDALAGTVSLLLGVALAAVLVWVLAGMALAGLLLWFIKSRK